MREPALRDFVAGRFYAVRFHRYGRKPIVGFDGVVRTEEQLAIHHAVIGTPTVEFRIADGSEVARISGYAAAPVLLAAFGARNRNPANADGRASASWPGSAAAPA